MRLLFVLLVVLNIPKAEAQSSALNLADSLYVNGNYSKAIAMYKTHGNQADVYDQIAKAYVAIGNYDLALDYYKRSVTANSKDALVLYEYAKLLSKTKKFEASILAFNDLMNIDYRNPNYHYEMGLAMERMKDSTAINRYRSAYELDQTHQKAIYKIARYYLKKGQYSLVDDYTDIGLKTYENNVELINLKAQSYYNRKYYTKAKPWFLKLIALGESSEFIHEKLSVCHADNYDYDLAIAQRHLVLKYNPFDSNSIYNIGLYYQQLKDYIKAEKYIKQAIAMKDVPLDEEYQRLGVILNMQNKHDQAIKMFQKSLKEKPDNIRSEFFIISTKDKYYADVDAKIKLYEAFIDKYPESFYSRFAKGRISELKEEKFLKAQD